MGVKKVRSKVYIRIIGFGYFGKRINKEEKVTDKLLVG